MTLRTDYLLHFLCGIIIAMTFYPFGLWWAVGTVVLAGALKEIGDKYWWKGSVELRDLLLTYAGGIVGIGIDVVIIEYITPLI